MEKYSQFRDSGTGIQVFLTPVPPASSSSSSPLRFLLLPVGFVLGVARCLLLAIIGALWTLLGLTLGSSRRAIDSPLKAFFGRLILLVLGFSLVKTETVSLKNRGRGGNRPNPFEPKRGDIIVSNFSSWLDILVMMIKFNPTFVLPVVEAPTGGPPSSVSGGATGASPRKSSSSAASVAKRRNAGAAVVTEMNEKQSQQQTAPSKDRFLGFQPVSLWKALNHVGRTPLIHNVNATTYTDLHTLSKSSPGPIMVFPELVTSNNRGLLRFASVFPPSWRDLYRFSGALRLGAGQANLFLLSIRHDSPSLLSPTATLSVPASLTSPFATINPLQHMWTLSTSLSFTRSISIRQLDPTESPTSGAYLADTSVTSSMTTATTGSGSSSSSSGSSDALTELLANNIGGLARLRRTGLGWEEKEVFLNLLQTARR